MKNRIRILCVIVVSTGFALALPCRDTNSAALRRGQARQATCSKEALAALNMIPKLNYNCGENDEDDLKSAKRRAALRAYLRKLESSARASWWAASVDDLNACLITNEVRELTESERREPGYTEVYGDQSARLLVVRDPCVKYSYMTRNAFVLQRAVGRVYATQVLDAFYTRADPGVRAELGALNGETLIIVKTDFADGFSPPTLSGTYSVYVIDPRSHHAVPKKLFMEQGNLTNQFEYAQYLFEDEQLYKQWSAPELMRNGRLLPEFYVYSLNENKLTRDTYVWKHKYYALQ
jgi:hypothetical protein